MAGPELSVVCKSCGSEVSPYVTECPYCGTRLRRRAPKLEREGDEIKVREGMRERRRRRAAERRAARERRALGWARDVDRPYVAIAAVLIPAVLLVVERAAGLGELDVGAILHPAFAGWWRYLAAPWVYDNTGLLFAVGVALAVFVPGLERRLGQVPTAILLIACGSLGMLGAVALDKALGDGIIYAAGGNGVALGALAAWFMLRRREAALDPTDELDPLLVGIAAVAIIAIPWVETSTSFWAGIIGGLVGLAAGWSATLGRGT